MKAQGLPVNMIVLTALALLVLVVVGAFFISGFGQASSGINVVNTTQADCQSMCQGLTISALNYDNCNDVNNIGQAVKYSNECSDNYGSCRVTLRTGDSCDIPQS